jgi:xanthine dehydrogenase accessory factor
VHLEVLVEPLIPPPLLVIAGGGHIGQALALQAGLVGFQAVVVDDRSEYVDPSLYPEGTDLRCGDIPRLMAEMPVAADTYIVIVTRGHQQDEQALAACIRRPAAYIGMIGSRRKVAMIRSDMLASGAATEAEFGRVFAPIGLDIGAQTVGEIAASIVAQLVAVRRRGTAPRMPTR